MAKPKESKSPFTRSIQLAIHNVITAMEEKQIKLAKTDFTPNELLHLFVNPEHRELLSKAWEVVEPAGSAQELHVNVWEANGPSIVFRWHWFNLRGGFYVPSKHGARADRAVTIRDDAPDDVKEKFLETANNLYDVHLRFSQVRRVYNNLNEPSHCATRAQMRYVWPCIYTLVNKAGYPDDAEMLREPVATAGDKVRVPPLIQHMLKPTNDTVMRALLIDDVTPRESVHIDYSMAHTFPTI